jgi:FMN phosphatase YigB (HAD superfamily)
MAFDRPIRAVTFDCWSTLIYEPDPKRSFALRVAAYRDLLGEAGEARSSLAVEASLNRAWTRHYEDWTQGRIAGAPEVARWSLEDLDVARAVELAPKLAVVLQETQLGLGIASLDGAQELLRGLRAAGIRRGLICDTGLTPGSVVRKLLDRAGLLDELEVLVFSDEAGVPKPHPRVFQRALEGLNASAGEALHVGDLRRTDVAGARGVGMATARIRGHHDDMSEHPEADRVVDSHAELQALLLPCPSTTPQSARAGDSG